MRKALIIGLASVGGVLFLIGFILLIRYSTLVTNAINKEMVLTEGSELFAKWSNVPLPIYMKYYMFDVQNADDVEFNGAKPILKERGPYTFLEKQWKEIIAFEDKNKYVSFKNFKQFHFLRHESVGDLTDRVTALNIPVAVSSSKVDINPIYLANALKAAIGGALREAETSELGMVIVDVVNAVLKELEEPLFEVRSLHELLFTGYRVPLLDRMGQIAAGFGLEVPDKLPNNTFGLMVNKNGSHSGVLKVHTGVYGQVFKVHSWNANSSVNFWNGSACNQINGTDGGGFGANVQRTDALYVFDPDFCRSAYVVYKEDSEVFGIPTYRFVIPDTFFKGPYNVPENECFCTQPEGLRDVCAMDGLLDMSSCSDGAPIAMSPVHFLGAPSSLRDNLVGLAPDPQRHEMFLDVEPINVRIKRNEEIPTVATVRDVVLPIMWLEESAGLDEKLAAEFRAQLRKITVGKVLLRCLTVLGLILGVAALALHVSKHNEKTTPETMEPTTPNHTAIVPF